MKVWTEYKDACRLLLRGFENLSDDIRFRKDGGKIYYVVDFSEIYAYTLPNLEPSNFFVFEDYIEPKDRSALERLVLRRLFYGHKGELILMPGYGLELQNFIQLLETQEIRNIIDDAINSFSEEIEILENENFYPIRFLIENLNHKPSPKEEEIIEQLMEDYLPSITRLLSPPVTKPKMEIRKLFHDGVFVNLNEVSNFTFEVDQVREDFLYDLLSGKRSSMPGAIRTDANVITAIEQANLELVNQNRLVKILLVTRSELSQRAYENLLPNKRHTIFRHPRMFNIWDLVGENDIDEKLGFIENRKKQLAEFLDIVDSHQQKSQVNFSQEHEEIIQYLVTTIMSDWVSQDRIVAARKEIQLDEKLESGSNIPKKSQHFINIIKNPKSALNKIILNKLTQMDNALKEGFSIDFDLVGYQQPSSFQAQTNKSGKQTHSTLQTMPYSLEIHSEQAKKLIDEFNKKSVRGRIGNEEIIDLLYLAYLNEQNYEVVLMLAYIFGTLGMWDAAERYCEQSLNIPSKEIPTNEGEFFYAVCMRKQNRSLSRHQRALKSLDRAIKIKQGFRRDSASKDPRYLKEKATHILSMHIHFTDTKEQIPSITQGLAYLDEAELLSKGDTELQIQIINNRLNFWIEEAIRKNELQSIIIKDNFDKLLEIQIAQYENPQAWPPAILHTMAMAAWLLRKEDLSLVPESIDIHTIQNWLELAMQGEHLMEKRDAGRIQEHIRLISSQI